MSKIEYEDRGDGTPKKQTTIIKIGFDENEHGFSTTEDLAEISQNKYEVLINVLNSVKLNVEENYKLRFQTPENKTINGNNRTQPK